MQVLSYTTGGRRRDHRFGGNIRGRGGLNRTLKGGGVHKGGGEGETLRAVAQVFVCALHRIWCKCGARQQSRVVSFLCVCGALRKVTAAESSRLPTLRA